MDKTKSSTHKPSSKSWKYADPRDRSYIVLEVSFKGQIGYLYCFVSYLNTLAKLEVKINREIKVNESLSASKKERGKGVEDFSDDKQNMSETEGKEEQMVLKR